MSKNRIKKELLERTLFEKIWGGVWFKRVENLGHDHRYFIRPTNGPTLGLIKWNNFNPRDFKVVFPVNINGIKFLRISCTRNYFFDEKVKPLIVSYFIKELNKAYDKGKIRTKTIPKL